MRHSALPFGFTSPETASVGGIKLGAVIAAVTLGDRVTLAAMRAEFAADAGAFDLFAAGVRDFGAGDYAAASTAFAGVQSVDWRVPAAILRAIALAAAGELRQAIAIANQIGDVVRASATAGAPGYADDAALHREGVRCLQVAEQAFPMTNGRCNSLPIAFSGGLSAFGQHLVDSVPRVRLCGAELHGLSGGRVVFRDAFMSARRGMPCSSRTTSCVQNIWTRRFCRPCATAAMRRCRWRDTCMPKEAIRL